MFTAGTAGHIDHGKTSLIKALTGTDCDRLPEEKERKLTTDLGFAFMELPSAGPVGIIDVPGHERFIRNMAAGTPGMDCALLVIGADDGWMPQTEDHLAVLRFLGVRCLIPVISKADLADDSRINFLKKDISERLACTEFRNSRTAVVSAKTGYGLNELKSLMDICFSCMKEEPDNGKPYLFADRCFEVRGRGTVVTGTLKNGFFNINDSVTIVPGRYSCRIKRIETGGMEDSAAGPGRRALNLSCREADRIRRGCLVFKDSGFTESSSAFVCINTLSPMKNNIQTEVMIGTSSMRAKVIIFKTKESHDPGTQKIYARLNFEKPVWCFPGQPFVLTSPGGFRIRGGGRILMPGFTSSDRKRLKEAELPEGSSLKELIFFAVSIRGCLSAEELYRMFTEGNDLIEKAADELEKSGDLLRAENFLVSAGLAGHICTAVSALLDEKKKISIKEAEAFSGLPGPAAALILAELIKDGRAAEKNGQISVPEYAEKDSLSEEASEALHILEQKGTAGLELSRISDSGLKRAVKQLISAGAAVSLDGDLIYEKQLYLSLRSSVMDLFNTVDRIGVADVRSATGLSRKYSVPMLARMERDGLVKRFGDYRVKS